MYQLSVAPVLLCNKLLQSSGYKTICIHFTHGSVAWGFTLDDSANLLWALSHSGWGAQGGGLLLVQDSHIWWSAGVTMSCSSSRLAWAHSHG